MSLKILFQSFLRETSVSSFSMSRDVYSLTLKRLYITPNDTKSWRYPVIAKDINNASGVIANVDKTKLSPSRHSASCLGCRQIEATTLTLSSFCLDYGLTTDVSQTLFEMLTTSSCHTDVIQPLFEVWTMISLSLNIKLPQGRHQASS